jgi:hypothetical protein
MDSVAVPHAAQHANINDAMEAVQAKLGTGAGTIGAWTSYTPTFSYITVGNSTLDFRYTEINKLVIVNGFFTLGSTGSLNPSLASNMSLPKQARNSFNSRMGFGQINDIGTATYDLWPLTIGSNAYYTTLFIMNSSGLFLREAGVNATQPMTWTTGDSFNITLIYEAF